jgi:hypothetical protein
MTVHFRGRPSDDFSRWLPICGSADRDPELTQRGHDATCPECRKIIGIRVEEIPPPRRRVEPPASRAFLDTDDDSGRRFP